MARQFVWYVTGARGTMTVERKRVAEAISRECQVLSAIKRTLPAFSLPTISGSGINRIIASIKYFKEHCE